MSHSHTHTHSHNHARTTHTQQTSYPLSNTTNSTSNLRDLSLPSSLLGPPESHRPRRLVDNHTGNVRGRRIVVVDEDEDEFDHEQEGGDHRRVPVSVPVSVGALTRTLAYPRAPGSTASSRGAGAVRDAPPRIELELSWASGGVDGSGAGGLGGGVIVEEQDDREHRGERNEDEDAGRRTRHETRRLSLSSSSSSSSHGPLPPFRDRLDSALEALRSPSSPLVPGLNTSSAVATTATEVNSTTINGGNNGNSIRIVQVPGAERGEEEVQQLEEAEEEGAEIDDDDDLVDRRLFSLPQVSVSVSSAATALPSSTSNFSPPRNTNSNANASAANPSMAVALPPAVATTANTPASFGGFGLGFGPPPTLPPIITDMDEEEGEVGESWSGLPGRQATIRRGRSSNTHLHTDNRPSHNRVRGQERSLRLSQMQLQRLGEVQLPSPSLSGFYDWLDGASVNAGAASAVVSAPFADESAVSERGEGVRNEGDRAGEARREQGQGQGSWEEDVLSGLLF